MTWDIQYRAKLLTIIYKGYRGYFYCSDLEWIAVVGGKEYEGELVLQNELSSILNIERYETSKASYLTCTLSQVLGYLPMEKVAPFLLSDNHDIRREVGKYISYRGDRCGE